MNDTEFLIETEVSADINWCLAINLTVQIISQFDFWYRCHKGVSYTVRSIEWHGSGASWWTAGALDGECGAAERPTNESMTDGHYWPAGRAPGRASWWHLAGREPAGIRRATVARLRIANARRLRLLRCIGCACVVYAHATSSGRVSTDHTRSSTCYVALLEWLVHGTRRSSGDIRLTSSQRVLSIQKVKVECRADWRVGESASWLDSTNRLHFTGRCSTL